MENFIKSLKITWIRRLIKSSKNPWNTFFNDNICQISKLSSFGTHFLKKTINSTKNKFWKTSLQAYYNYSQINKPKTLEEKLCSPLWYNEEISTYELFIPDWYKNGIITPGDLLDENLQMIPRNDLIRKFKITYKRFSYIRENITSH